MLQSWPVTLDTDDTRKGRLPGVYRAPTAEMLSYLDFSVSTTGMLAGIKMSHASTTALCRSVNLNHLFGLFKIVHLNQLNKPLPSKQGDEVAM